ncbi:UNVERIFIED_CONTAM: hypothetical protein Slati_4519500 [Sesamum latifolium]|uniref:Uncharacterized protein n=1 Tax=Sesamum latifolium TaxID=2727402 RepID=A0AAW2SGL0_9LAMI
MSRLKRALTGLGGPNPLERMMSMARGRALNGLGWPHFALPTPRKLEYRPRSFVQTDFLGAKIQSREGNSPDRTLRAQVIHRSDETLKAAFSSVSSERSVNRGRFLVTRPGDIRSENADMSNEKSVKNTIACQWKVFCVQSIYAE